MTDQYKTELDKIENRERRKIIYVFALGIASIFIAIALGLFFYSGDIENVTGTVTAVTEGGYKGNKRYFIVVLDQGRTVKALAPNSAVLDKGKKAVLNEVTNIFGFKLFYFKEYLKAPEPHYRKITL